MDSCSMRYRRNTVGQVAIEEEKQFCRNRLNVNYNPEAPKPEMWLKYLKDLVEEEDIPTIQEYLGYLLICRATFYK